MYCTRLNIAIEFLEHIEDFRNQKYEGHKITADNLAKSSSKITDTLPETGKE